MLRDYARRFWPESERRRMAILIRFRTPCARYANDQFADFNLGLWMTFAYPDEAVNVRSI